MTTQPITIHVDESAARIFKNATPEERRKLEALISLQLLDAGAPGLPLRDLMQMISQRAQARGLTEEKLQELLADDPA
jgi:hypothetical protein